MSAFRVCSAAAGSRRAGTSPRGWAEGVVEALEVIDVDMLRDRGRAYAPARRTSVSKRLLQVAAVEEAGQGVVVRSSVARGGGSRLSRAMLQLLADRREVRQLPLPENADGDTSTKEGRRGRGPADEPNRMTERALRGTSGHGIGPARPCASRGPASGHHCPAPLAGSKAQLLQGSSAAAAHTLATSPFFSSSCTKRP